jgi:hypothetical protein
LEKVGQWRAQFNMSTELASGVALLANGENGGRRGTVPFTVDYRLFLIIAG